VNHESGQGPSVEATIDQAALFANAQVLFQDRFILDQLVAASYARALFLARDPILKRAVAVRVHLDPTGAGRIWFVRESELLAAVDHPSIRPIYTAGFVGEWAYRASKWIEGESLLQAVARGPRPIPEVLRIARDLAGALAYAHSQQIVIRRIVPGTVMLDRGGNAIITDLRFANRVLDVADPTLVNEAEPFLAPETWHGHAGESASDVYAAGALLYFAITGIPPANDPRHITPPIELRPSCPQVVQRVILRALQPDPRERYLNAAELLDELHSTMGDFDVPIGTPSVTRRSDNAEAWEKLVRRALGDEYELLDELGAGGFGYVYRVRDLRLERDVALKILHPHLTTDPAAIERFRREAQLAAQLSHPNIVDVYGTGGRAGLLWYTMAYIAGVNLGRVVQRDGPLPFKRVMRIMDEALDALAHAHRRGVIHRDIKPENLLITDLDGSVRITDFGLAMALQRGYGGASSHSGTPEFASPEQLLGEQVDRRSDLYSLSLVAIFALTGKPPFGGGTVESILAKQATGQLPDLRTVRQDIPERVIRALEHAAERLPDDRFPTAEDFERELRAGRDSWETKPKWWLRRLFR
jgi:eukaryotic-like serine/threonine-protein kinase